MKFLPDYRQFFSNENRGSQLLQTHLRVPIIPCLFVGWMVIMTIFILYRSYDQPKNCSDILEAIRESVSQTIRDEISKKSSTDDTLLPVIYVITPTYKRLEQIPELTRLGQTLMNVPSLHWIIADDAAQANKQLIEYLEYSGIPYTYLLTPMPEQYKTAKAKPKGVANRNGGLQWIREHATDGVVYFADDDNTYDIRLFEEIRKTQRVSMFPVGLVTGYGLSTPVLKNGKFHSFYDGWIGGRKYPVDMAGFAFSVKHLLQTPAATMPYKAGYEEDGFLRSLEVEPADLEFLADGCTKIYVWHTQTKKNNPSDKKILNKEFDGTNLRVLEKVMTLKP